MHPRLRGISSKEVERILRRNGFELSRSRGDHLQFGGFIQGQKRELRSLQIKNRSVQKH